MIILTRRPSEKPYGRRFRTWRQINPRVKILHKAVCFTQRLFFYQLNHKEIKNEPSSIYRGHRCHFIGCRHNIGQCARQPRPRQPFTCRQQYRQCLRSRPQSCRPLRCCRPSLPDTLHHAAEQRRHFHERLRCSGQPNARPLRRNAKSGGTKFPPDAFFGQSLHRSLQTMCGRVPKTCRASCRMQSLLRILHRLHQRVRENRRLILPIRTGGRLKARAAILSEPQYNGVR